MDEKILQSSLRFWVYQDVPMNDVIRVAQELYQENEMEYILNDIINYLGSSDVTNEEKRQTLNSVLEKNLVHVSQEMEMKSKIILEWIFFELETTNRSMEESLEPIQTQFLTYFDALNPWYCHKMFTFLLMKVFSVPEYGKSYLLRSSLFDYIGEESIRQNLDKVKERIQFVIHALQRDDSNPWPYFFKLIVTSIADMGDEQNLFRIMYQVSIRIDNDEIPYELQFYRTEWHRYVQFYALRHGLANPPYDDWGRHQLTIQVMKDLAEYYGPNSDTNVPHYRQPIPYQESQDEVWENPPNEIWNVDGQALPVMADPDLLDPEERQQLQQRRQEFIEINQERVSRESGDHREQLSEEAQSLMSEINAILVEISKCYKDKKIIEDHIVEAHSELQKALLECSKDDVEPFSLETIGDLVRNNKSIVLASDGHLYDVENITHKGFSGKSPLTRKKLSPFTIFITPKNMEMMMKECEKMAKAIRKCFNAFEIKLNIENMVIQRDQLLQELERCKRI